MRNAKYLRAAVVLAMFASLILANGARRHTSKDSQPLHIVAQEGLRSEIFLNSEERAFEHVTAPDLANQSPESSSSNSIFYSMRPDFRRCIAPLCGGYFVKRVNQSRTRCANGRLMAECYVAEIDWSDQPQIEPGKALLRGRVVERRFGTFGNLGALRVTEAWQAASDQMPAGTFYRVRDRGVRCITFPCPTHREAKLNSAYSRDIAGVDLNGSGAGRELISEASAAMAGTEGVLVAGDHVPVNGPGGKSQTLKATQFYLRAGRQAGTRRPVPASPVMKPCIKTGCSSEVCADHDVITTCVYRPEYACYQKARCERQANGNCGFTRTPELSACLAGK
jgi:hypothetical protein